MEKVTMTNTTQVVTDIQSTFPLLERNIHCNFPNTAARTTSWIRYKADDVLPGSELSDESNLTPRRSAPASMLCRHAPAVPSALPCTASWTLVTVHRMREAPADICGLSPYSAFFFLTGFTNNDYVCFCHSY